MSETNQPEPAAPSGSETARSGPGRGTDAPKFARGRPPVPTANKAEARPGESELYFDSAQGTEHRLDQAHQADAARLSAGDAGPATEAVDPSRRQDRPLVSREQRELLLQASQIAEQLQDQFRELDRREQGLNEQLAALDQERRALRLRVQQFEDEMLDREEGFRGQQAEFASKFATCEKLVAELEEQQQELDQARAALNGERSRLREELGRDLEVERSALRQAQGALEAERRQMQLQMEERNRASDAEIEQQRRQLDEERKTLRETLGADLDRQRAEFERERDEWTKTREAERAELRREREINESAVTRAQEELLFWKREQEAEIERRTHELEASLDQIREKFEQEQQREQADWDARREAEMCEINRQRESAEQALRESDEERERQREEFERELAAQREEFNRECETRRQQLKQERAVLENRMRFQQEHLHKARQELESLQRETRLNRQQAVAEDERRSTLLRLRKNQLQHFRLLLDEREQSFEREHQLLAGLRRNLEADGRRDKARLRQEQEAWEQERQAQQAELRRQQDMLALHAENLEARRERLDQLRSELEETHRRILEMRMSMEEAWAQLAQAAGADVARQRVEQAREALSDHYRQLAQTVSGQRQELLEAQGLFERQRDEFRTERHKLTDWIAEREAKLRGWEAQLRRETETLDARHANWRSTRDSWLREKIAAEGVIRSLLSQLTALNETDPPHEAVADPTNPSEAASGPDDDSGGEWIDPRD